MSYTTGAMRALPKEPEAGFNGPHSAAIRIWHWTLFLVMTGSLITVLLASTVFRTGKNTLLVQNQLQTKGVIISSDQARAVSHAFNDKLWELHKWLGYIICGLVLARFAIELGQPRSEKLNVQLKKVIHAKPNDPGAKAERQHYIQVKSIYLAFYAVLLLMALTGLGLAFDNIPFLRSIRQPVKQVHSFMQYLIYGFLFIHLAGVIMAELGKHKGLVSGMINGRRE
ncbi:MAG TPA: cytochrome b/b6 domain-containing protein [Puia sp.]|nr:cytochrome b/b6 domain-containing protein [Puia sp.]